MKHFSFTQICFTLGWGLALGQDLSGGTAPGTGGGSSSSVGSALSSATTLIPMPCDADRNVQRGSEINYYSFNTTGYPSTYPNNEWCEIQLRNNDHDNLTILISCENPEFYDDGDRIEFFYDSIPFFGIATYAKAYQKTPVDKTINYVLHMEKHKTLTAVFESDNFGVSNGTTCTIAVLADEASSSRSDYINRIDEVTQNVVAGVLTQNNSLVDPDTEMILQEIENIQFSSSSEEYYNCTGDTKIAEQFKIYVIQSPNYPGNYPNNHRCEYVMKNNDYSDLKLSIICLKRSFLDKNDKLSFYFDNKYFFGVTAWLDEFKGGPPILSSTLSYELNFEQYKTLNISFSSDDYGTDSGFNCVMVPI